MYAKFLVPAIAVLGLVAEPTVAQELTGTLKKVKDSGSITIGHRKSSVPFSYYDDKQTGDRLCDGPVPQDRRCREERGQAGQA